ncbi:MAG: hypothetical protein IJ623_02595 [Bacteroidales bacterium]|nr:hypothetical protein [Bacteroidales bacterium]
MKKLLYIGLAAAAGLAFFACSKDTVKGTDTPEESTGKLVTITASIPEEGLATKVSFAEDETTLRLTKIAWEAGDVLDIAGKTFTIVDASISTDGKTASFTGEEPAAASSYTVTYNSIASKGIDLNAQKQASNGSTDHLGYSIVVEATDYKTVSFESATSQSSVLQLRAKLPDGIKDDVKKVIFKSNLAVFNGEKQLTVELENGTTGTDNLLNVYATLPTGAQTLSEKMELLIQFQVDADKEYEKYTAYREFPANTAFIKDGAAQYIGIDCTNIVSYANKTNTQIGSADNPYLIGDKYQLKKMSSELAVGEIKYFKLVDDVDLNKETWNQLNADGSFNKGIDFDGNGKTISNLKSTGKYAGFAGVLYGKIYNLTFDNAEISSGNQKAGVVAGFLGTGTDNIKASCKKVTVKNSSVTNTDVYVGGFAGIAQNLSEPLEDCHVINTKVTGATSNDARAGGLVGQVVANMTVSGCTAEGVEVSGIKNVGALIGVNVGTVSNCSSTSGTVSGTTNAGGLIGYNDGTISYSSSSGKVSSPNTTSNADIALGGLVGFLNKGKISSCSSSVTINQTTNGRDIGGLVGSMKTATIEKSFATGNVAGIQRNVGGLVGLVTLTSGTAKISDSYCTGNVHGDAYSGGFLGYHEKGTVNITNCYATSPIPGNFALGGFVGVVGSADMSISNSVAWNSSVTASSHGSGNWSTGAVVGVAFPTCTLTDNYRNPNMSLTAYWVPASDYQHANVSASHPLTDSTGAEMTDASTANGQAHYPQYPYHGKVEAGKTLSQLASTTLGWDSTIWDFNSGDLPKLIGVN